MPGKFDPDPQDPELVISDAPSLGTGTNDVESPPPNHRAVPKPTADDNPQSEEPPETREKPTETTGTKTANPSTSAPQGGRTRRRRNVVGNSAHVEEYRRLMEAGWSSFALERYAIHRYGEDIPASTFRSYKSRAKIAVPAHKFGDVVTPDNLTDIVGMRATLIQMQLARIGIDFEHEESMKKLFSGTGREIKLLDELLGSYKQDLQDLGAFPKAGELLRIQSESSGPSAAEAPKAKSLADALGIPEGDEPGMAKLLHLATHRANAG